MKFAALGFTCIDVYKNLGIQYPTGNGIDLLFNLMEQVEEIEPSVVTAVGDDEMEGSFWKRAESDRWIPLMCRWFPVERQL